MKKIFTIFNYRFSIFFFLSCVLILDTKISYAQCPGCVIDTTNTQPGIYPNPLTNGIVGVAYDQDVTFVMFTDTQGFTVNYFQIVSVTGLPFGLNWQCNNSGNGCIYNPATSIFGCVKICGTPLQSGAFTINVGVVVNLQTVGNQNSTIQIALTIDPASGGNSGFTFTPTSGCDSATINFHALITSPTNPVTYAWTFGNGNTSNLQDPPSQFYNAPGDYPVTLVTNILGYVVTEVNIFSTNQNWCGDVEEPNIPIFGCQGAPDLFFELSSSQGIQYTSSTINDVTNGSWNGLTISLSNPPYAINLWDYDPVSPNDNLGTFPFNLTGAGTISFSGAGGTSGNIIIGTEILSTFTNVDTIHIYASPSAATITYSPNDSICEGDFVTLTAHGTNGNSIQWYNNGHEIGNATDSTLVTDSAGNYSVLVTNIHGCSAMSTLQHITVVPLPPKPTFLINGQTITCFLTGYPLQWYENGAAISGATGFAYTVSQAGFYFVMSSNSFGCMHSSDTVFMTNGIFDNTHITHFNVFPNPAHDEVTVTLNIDIAHDLEINLFDLLGRKICGVEKQNAIGEINSRFNVENLAQGIYYISIKGLGSEIKKMIVIE